MEKIRVGIVGYGNLGKGAELNVLDSEDMELVAIFTRRNPGDIQATKNVKVVQIDELKNYKNKIDVLILCGGSSKDLPLQSPLCLSLFNCVDSFDTHTNMSEHFDKMDRTGKLSGKLGAISIGWDPGLFSMARLMFASVMPNGRTYTFWGKGVSQGHSEAIRRIEGVKTAIQYTIPKKDAIEKVKSGVNIELTAFEKHLRECYVVLEDSADKKLIEEKIKTMPNYYKGYDTVVKFISEEEFQKCHTSKLNHGGAVIHSAKNLDNKFSLEFNLNLDSNPEFTAAVLVAYARAVFRLNSEGKCGCVTVYDIPLSYLSNKPKEQLYKELL
ncbi:MAG: diaminopimelate dehydrogenase [Firmicutes bacterium]|nr:diaminopimelate dehydrogenase [Bacillota bacterium]